MKQAMKYAAGVLCVLSSSVTLASLGGSVDTVESDRVKMKAAAVTTSQSRLYTVHQMQTSRGTTVREFANNSGIVFALTWQGPFMPDLRQTLGSYFPRYDAAAREKHYGHSHLSVEQSDLVVRSAGHQRAFSGIAFVPSLLPPGVSIDQLSQAAQ